MTGETVRRPAFPPMPHPVPIPSVRYRLPMRTARRYSFLIGWIPVFAAVASAALVLRRELWFDEAITVSLYMMPLKLHQIYLSYVIPNNQIAYTVLLKLWNGMLPDTWPANVAFWRILSLLAAVAAMVILYRLRSKLHDRTPWGAVTVLTALAVSPAFQNYATALRGYALSWFWIALSLDGAWRVFHGHARSGWCLYAAGMLGAVGTVPTNLLACVGVVIYAFPWCGRDCLRDRRFLLLAAGPFLSIAVFYLPILHSFLNTFSLNEGFSGRFGALAVVYGSIAVTFGILPLVEIPRLKRRGLRRRFRCTIWFLPVPAILLLPNVPFPRVFCTLFPLYAMLLADGIAAMGRVSRIRVAVSAGCLLVSLAALRLCAPAAASASGLSEYEDDYFRPWYMAKDYSVRELLPELEKRPGVSTVFMSFASDPCPLMFYAALRSVKRDFLPDQPVGKVKTLPPSALFVLRRDESPEAFEARFGGKLLRLFTGHDCNVYLFAADAPPTE